jgi:hypothetical protein
MAHLPVYLADFSCFNAPDELKVDFFKSQEAAWKWKVSAWRGCSWITQAAQCGAHRALIVYMSH